MRTLACKHKIWGKNWLYLRPYLKALPVFNVLETCREYFLTIDLGIVEFRKKFIEQFLDVIWSMPKNFAFFQKPLDKFFYKFDKPEINCQEVFPASFKNIENREGF